MPKVSSQSPVDLPSNRPSSSSFPGMPLAAGIAIVLLIIACGAVAQPAAVTPSSIPVASDRFAAFVSEAARRFDVPAPLIRAIIRAESFGDVHALSSKGAMGLMQIMPATWADMRARYGLGANPFDPHDNILAGAAYLRALRHRYGAPGFLAAYNAGPGRYEDHLASGRPLPAETRAYLTMVAPMLAHVDTDHAMMVAVAAPSWTEAPIFVARAESSPTAARAASGLRPGHPSGREPGEDLTALAPRSGDLFVIASPRNPGP